MKSGGGGELVHPVSIGPTSMTLAVFAPCKLPVLNFGDFYVVVQVYHVVPK